MPTAFGAVVRRLEVRLRNEHPSLREATNPVLVETRQGHLNTSRLADVLGQYAFLPARIVDLLRAGCQRAENWPAVRAELKRNVAEELGSRTGGISHYELLKLGVRRELGLELERSELWPETEQFLRALFTALAGCTPAFAAGVVYALEDSAIPELTIVAHLVNEYAAGAGREGPVIHLERLEQSVGDTRRAEAGLSLHEFFAMHLVDFEVGHRTRLADALSRSLTDGSDLDELEAGYTSVLDAMDRWWQSLADRAARSAG